MYYNEEISNGILRPGFIGQIIRQLTKWNEKGYQGDTPAKAVGM